MTQRKKNPHAVALGRLGGRARTERKAQAVRKNGKRGGRPRKGPGNGREVGEPR
jgi:hypothetical protein